MNISIFVGSPRKKGNSNNIAKYFQNSFKTAEKENEKKSQIKIYRLDELEINPCKGCGYCDEKAECVIDDGMTSLYPVVDNSDLLVFVTPVYFASMPAQLKAFIDRFQPYYAAKYLLKKPRIPMNSNKKVILYVISGYNKEYFFENIKQIIEIFCLNLNFELFDSFYYGGLDFAGEVLQRPKILKEIENYSKELGKHPHL